MNKSNRPFLRIETNGTGDGTKVFAPNGEEIKGIISVIIPPITGRSDERATVEFYVAGGKMDQESPQAAADTAARPPHAMSDESLVNTLLGLTMLASGALPGPTRDRTNALKMELMRRLDWTRDIFRARGVLNAGDNETLVAAADRVMADWHACMEELDADGCAKWKNERGEMVRELKQAGKDREQYTNRVLAMLKDTARAAGYDPDEATHGDEIVAGTIKAIKAMRDCMEHAWGLIANAGGGEWAKEGAEWQHGAKTWRETFTKLQSAFCALNRETEGRAPYWRDLMGDDAREVPGAEAEVSKECGHHNVWAFHVMPDPNDETCVIQHGKCVECEAVVNRWAPNGDLQPPGQWCVGQGENLELPRAGFINPFVVAQGEK